MGAAMRYQPQGRIQFAGGLRTKPCAAFVGTSTGLRIIGDGKHDPYAQFVGGAVTVALGPTGYATKTLASSTSTVRLNALANQLDTAWEKPTAQVTVMLVFRRFGAPAGVAPLFGNQCPNNTPYTAWCLEDQPSGLARFEIALGGTNADPTMLAASVALPNNQLIVLIGRYDGAKMDLWLNGARVGQQAAAGPITYPNAPDRGPSVNNYYNFTASNRSALIEAYAGALWDTAISDAEIARYSANPWALFDAGSSSSAYQAAIASASATSGSAPTTIGAGEATASIVGIAARVALPSTVAANEASTATSGLAAAISLPTTVAANPATEAEAGKSASIVLPTSIAAGEASATDSGLSANVSTGSAIGASTASETSSGLAAGVVLPTSISASEASATDSGLAANITTGSGLQASTATESASGLSAAVSLPTVIGARTGTATDAGLSAVITSGAGIQAGVASESDTGQQAQITLPTVVAASEGTVTINCQPATISTGSAIGGTTGTGTDTGYPAQVSSTTGVNAGVADESARGLAANINSIIPPLAVNPARLYEGEPRARAIYGGKDDVQNLTAMIVGDVETFSYNFKKTLPSGATITGAVPHIVVHAGIDPNPQAMVVGQPTISGSIVSIELQALVPGVSYWPRMTATYSDRQQVTLPDPGKGSLSVVA